jgi:hypothetical protein
MKADNEFQLAEALRLVEEETCQKLAELLNYDSRGLLFSPTEAGSAVLAITRRAVPVPDRLSVTDRYLFVLEITRRGYQFSILPKREIVKVIEGWTSRYAIREGDKEIESFALRQDAEDFLRYTR